MTSTPPASRVRILFLADTHLGFDLPKTPRVNRRRRGPDFFTSLDRALAPAREGRVDLVVHGGDVFHRSRVRPEIVLMALDYSEDEVTEQNLVDAVRDYLPSRDVVMLEYMELLAVFEASNRKMLPKKYADLGVDELSDRLNRLKLEVGNRR